jgi:hypothetical protein
MLTATINAKFEKMERDQNEIKNKLESLVAGVLGAFEDVSKRLKDLKAMTDMVGSSALGLHSVVSVLENKSMAPSPQDALEKGRSSQRPQDPASSHAGSGGLVRKSNANLKVSSAVPPSGSSSPATRSPSPTNTDMKPLSPNVVSPNANGSVPKVFKLPDEVLAFNLSKDETQRQSIMYEIIDSEIDYVRDLTMTIDVSNEADSKPYTRPT